ncbi:hypothetical protein H0H81_009830 [Sphagnurus paluster]|uniref:Uncharacterized protein n=1 Tax=Sphagnurus paluster TaxID=117069 RepID=A0A9P7FVK7_9AGAR|nr:hypothetical protein H0H81_009830 [Sphagnurus paluster]
MLHSTRRRETSLTGIRKPAKDGQHGVCVFRRRKTLEHGHRGFRLSSVGILLAKSRRPRPWRHVAALKELVAQIHTEAEADGESESEGSNKWALACAFFEERRVRRADLGGAGDWLGWSSEIFEDLLPTLHLPHMLRLLGPSSLTLYKHVLGRRRILVYTAPPVEPASILCHAAADLCFEAQLNAADVGTSRARSPLAVLGMVTLIDMDRLGTESSTGHGWIACTTDALFLEKPACYDLLIDLTTPSPTFSASKPVSPPVQNGKTHRLSTVRFSWSDVKLWNELERILTLAPSSPCPGCASSSSTNSSSEKPRTWPDAWRVYEDVCVLCAGLWMGPWRTIDSGVRLEGDDDLGGQYVGETKEGPGAYVRSLGMGIEGRPPGPGGSLSAATSAVPATPSSPALTQTARSTRRTSGLSWSSVRGTAIGSPSLSSFPKSIGIGKGKGKGCQPSSSGINDGAETLAESEEDSAEGSEENEGKGGQARTVHVRTTHTLLQTFHAHTAFQVSVLEGLLPALRRENRGGESSPTPRTVVLAPKDMLAFELGPLSSADVRYLEWLAAEYAPLGTNVVVRRGWREVLGVLVGWY